MRDDRGIAAIEYGVMALLIIFALAAAAGLVGAGINNMMTAAANAF